MQASSCFKWLQLLQASHPDAEAATIETDQLFLVSPSLERENPSQELPIDLPSGLIAQVWVRCLLLNQGLAREVETPLLALLTKTSS